MNSTAKIPALTECDPGLAPTEYNILIIPEVIEEKTKGGLFLPEQVKETDELAQTRGRIVAASPLAFNYDNWPETARKPQVGDVVWYGRYAGTLIEGRDGKTYRLCKDKDVGAVVLDA
ncbi:co-chaperone GroES [Phenylobacterium deserti]|uniref:co-chaperone GroES n=1 Tax=Phenylobacterium deserti TaxID=1914756 RepID=UPI0014034048|nr:co-chaperone GroES [Phenylobacterium deserti]